MIPLAFLKSMGTKFHILSSRSYTNKDLLRNAINLLFYTVMGVPILCVNFFADSMYFWAFNVSKNVQSNEVFTENSQLTFQSFYEIMLLCKRFLS